MSTPDGIHYDGDYTNPVQDGPFQPGVDEEVQTTLYKAYFMQIAANFVRAQFGIAGPYGSTLVEESEFSYPGGEMIRWARSFAVKPPSRTVPEPFIYPFQEAIEINGQWQLVEFPLFLTSYVTYDYFVTTNPGAIKLSETYRLQIVLNGVYAIGAAPKPNASNVIAENAKLTRWRGNIWERATRSIPVISITGPPS